MQYIPAGLKSQSINSSATSCPPDKPTQEIQFNYINILITAWNTNLQRWHKIVIMILSTKTLQINLLLVELYYVLFG
jgi:hypothetical protein